MVFASEGVDAAVIGSTIMVFVESVAAVTVVVDRDVVVGDLVVDRVVVDDVVVVGGAVIVDTMIVSFLPPTVRPTASPIVSMVSTKAAAMAITAFVFKAMNLFKFSRRLSYATV